MRGLIQFCFVVLITTITVPSAIAQQQVRTAVYLKNTTEDAVGRVLAFEIREGIRRSEGLTLVDRDVDARFILRLVTIDPDRESSPGLSTVYSSVYTMRTLHDAPVEMYLKNAVGSCGKSRVASCARGMTATLDEFATELRTMLKDYLDPPSK